MLQTLRDNMKGTVAVVIVSLMVIPLVLFGVDSLFLNTNSEPTVAEVNGEEITESDLTRAIARQKQVMRQRFGDNLPESFLSDENLRGPALEQLIERSLWLQEAEQGDMMVSIQRIDRIIAEAPDFQRDGVFSTDLFRFQANNQGYTSTEFRELIKQDVSVDFLRNSIVANGFITQQQLEQLAAIFNQTRDFYYATIPVAPLREGIEIDEAKVQAYYDENQSQFLSPEQVVVDYLELTLDSIARTVEISEEEVRAQYELEVKEFEGRPEYQAAHILVEKKDDGSEQNILQEVQDKLAAGAEFSALAEEYSEDFGSKDSGGELGFTVGDTFPEEFETALAALEVGAVSVPVETEAGFHIIKKLSQRNVEPPSFEAEQARIRRQLQENRAEDTYLKMVQQLEDISYSAPDLNEAAQALELPIKTSAPFARSGGPGIFSNSEVIQAAFGPDVLTDGHNSRNIEINPNHAVVLRLKEHRPEHVREFAEVKEQIVAILKDQEATLQLQVKGETLQQAIKDGKSIEEVAQENGYEWQVSLATTRTSPQVRRDIVNKAFSLPPPGEGETVVDGLVGTTGDYVVVHLTKVKDGNYTELTEAEKNSLREQMLNLEAESDYSAYLAYLREDADIDTKEE